MRAHTTILLHHADPVNILVGSYIMIHGPSRVAPMKILVGSNYDPWNFLMDTYNVPTRPKWTFIVMALQHRVGMYED